jgi:hypothetical protein
VIKQGWRSTICLAVLVAAAGCTTLGGGQRAGGSASRVLTLDERQLANRAGTLLHVLRMDAGPMLVRETAGCPEITFRGSKRFYGVGTPSIYVNGMRALNTCVLEEFAATDVRLVEIYPSGVANRPGYANSSDGLILVFLLGTE